MSALVHKAKLEPIVPQYKALHTIEFVVYVIYKSYTISGCKSHTGLLRLGGYSHVKA